MKEVMLTTIDNPFNPFTNYDEWFAYDNQHGYNTPGLIARLTYTSDSISLTDQEDDIERTIFEIEETFNGFYKVISQDMDY